MSADVSSGDLVILTQAYEEYMFRKNIKLGVSLVNRMAKIEEIIDWESEKGKKIKKAREDSGKWKDLPIEESKYVMSVYYHDLVGRNGQRGVIDRTCLFSHDPKTRTAFFEKMPIWMYREIAKKCATFDVEFVTREREN